MTAEPVIEALDFPVEYWGEDDDLVCGHRTPRSSPDKRCKSGTRYWEEPCYHVFSRDWDTLRELMHIVAGHMKDAHPEVQDTSSPGKMVPG